MTRLIVTSDRNGKSSVGVDRPIPSAPFASVPGFDPALIWGTAATPSVPWDGRNVADERKSVLPEVGETRLMMVTFPPDPVMMSSDNPRRRAGAMSRLPLAERFEPDSPDATTDTVDYGIPMQVRSRSNWRMGRWSRPPGDIVVQNGTRYAWRNGETGRQH
jgi:hypothetical protein